MIKPQIVNIINFIRGVEPRDSNLDLLEPVVKQIGILKGHRLPATFLLQHDALLQERFTQVLADSLDDTYEIGGWFEVVQSLVEKAGLQWRGRPGFSWDWHAHVGFSIGYTPEEREKLVDAYMDDFKKVFGRYPQSMGAWIMDAHTLAYMADRYGIRAACICRDQWGTDGYSLWGGYYNQAYYPSKKNVFAPAQTEENTIFVPVFRMLGSDPIYQYDAGLADGDTYTPSGHQPVITLEPVYPEAGGSPDWVRWYFRENFNGKCLSFGYTQAGQENSFGWPMMSRGFTDQMELIAEKAAQGELRVETLGSSGKWYRSQYNRTPASAMSAETDWQDRESKSVWFYNRFYRVNFYMEGDRLWIRDIHRFDESCEERYLTKTCSTESFVYDNLPVIDGNRWSRGKTRAGIYPVRLSSDGAKEPLRGADPVVQEAGVDALVITWNLRGGMQLRIHYKEREIEISCSTPRHEFDWGMEMVWGDEVEVPILSVEEKAVSYKHQGHSYQLRAAEGSFLPDQAKKSVLLSPEDGKLVLSI